MKNDIWSPFPSDSDQFSYLNANFDKIRIAESDKDIRTYTSKDESDV